MDPYELALRRELGLPDTPEEEEEGSDLFQPIRTFFGGTQGSVPAALSGLMPEQYAAAREEMRQNLGVDETAPWYEQVEALPGAADVATQFIPTAVREATPAAIGSGLRLIGNIAGDPTTYIGGILVKAGTKIAAGSEAGLAALRAAEVGNAVAKVKTARAVELGQLSTREAKLAVDQTRRAGLTGVTKALMAESPVRGRAFMAARAIKEAEPYAMGTAAAVAYGPQVVRAGLESGKDTVLAALPESLGGEGDAGKALDSGGNFLLMAGLGYLMGKGLINTAKAKSVLTKELADQGVIPDIDKMIRERAAETGVAPDLTPVQMPPVARPAARRAPFGETPMPETLPPFEGADLLAPRRFRGPVGGDWEALQAEVNAAEPLGGPVPTDLPPRPVQVPEGFRGRVLSDEELLARIQEAGERGRALAREQVRPVVPEGAAPPIELGPRMEENLAALDIAPETFPPRPGQTVLPGMAEPHPITRTTEPAPRRRGRAKQVPLDLGEGQTIPKPLTRAEAKAAREAEIEAKLTEARRLAADDPDVQASLHEQALAGMRRDHEANVRGKGSKAGNAAERDLLASGNMENAAYRDWYNGHRAAAEEALATRWRKAIEEGADPAETLRERKIERDERVAIQEESGPTPAEPTPVEPTPVAEPTPVVEAAPEPTPVARPRKAPRAPRRQPVETEPGPTPQEPTPPVPEAPAATEPVAAPEPVAEPTAVIRAGEPTPKPSEPEPTKEPVAHKPSTPEQRMAWTEEEWAEDILRPTVEGERARLTPEVRAAFEADPSLRGRLTARIKEHQARAKKEVKDLGEGAVYDENRARNAAWGALRKLVLDEGIGKQATPKKKVEPPVVKDVEEEGAPLAGGPEDVKAGGIPDAEGGGRNRKVIWPEELGGRVDSENVDKPPSIREKAKKRAEEGETLSPEGTQWHERLWPVISGDRSIGDVLEPYVGQSLGDRNRPSLKLNRKSAEIFSQFQQLYDQARKSGSGPKSARAFAISTVAGNNPQLAASYRSNIIGPIEKFLAKKELEKAAAERGIEAPAPKTKPAPAHGREDVVERKRRVGQRLATELAAYQRGEKNRAAILDVIREYDQMAKERKELGHLGRGGWTDLDDTELRNFAKAVLPSDELPKKARPAAADYLDALAKHFGSSLAELRSTVKAEAPRATRAPQAMPSRLPEGWKPTKGYAHQPEGVGGYLSERGTRIETTTGDGGRLDATVYEAKDVTSLADDIEELFRSGSIARVIAGKPRPKGWALASTKALERLGDEVNIIDSENVDGLVLNRSKTARMETRNLRDVAGNDWTRHVDFDNITVGTKGTSPDALALADHMAEPDDALKTVEPIAKSLGVTVDPKNPVIPIRGGSWFHQVYLLNGKGKDGRQYVMRIGKSPYLELPRPDQRALVNVPVKTGEFTAVTGQRFTYGVHPYAWSPGTDITLGSLPGREKIVQAFKGHYDAQTLPSKVYEQRVLAELQGRLPEGIGLGEYLEDAAKLNAELSRVGLIDGDIFDYQREWRSGQTGYVKLWPGEAPSGVVRVAPDGSRYKLTVLDLGSVHPQELRGQWGQVPRSMFVALRQSEENLPLNVQRALDERMSRAEGEALDIGDGLSVVNHDDAMGWGYAALVAKYGKEPAKGMRKLVEELVDLIKPKTKVEFKGLTTSPYLSGLYREGVKSGNARIYTNIVEAVHASKSYDDALELTTKTLIHEVAHLGDIKHDGKFTDLQGYIDNLAKSEDWQAHAKQVLKDSGFTEELYGRIKEDLVDQFHAAREAIIGRRGAEAEGATIEGVPGRNAAGSAAAKSNLAGGGAQAPPGRGGAGLRPGGDVPGGGVEQAGRLRSAAAAGERDAAGLAEGDALGSLAREGAGPEESLIARLEARPGGVKTYEDGLDILDRMTKSKVIPITALEDAARQTADALSKSLPDDEIAKLLKSAPDPRGRPGVQPGGVNLLYDIPGVSDRGKAKVVLFSNLMDDAGLTDRSKVMHYDDLTPEVREMVGADTPEGYIRMMQHRGGGITAKDHIALVTARDELLRDADYLDGQWQKAMADGDEAAATKLFEAREKADRNAAASITIVQNKLTGAARALGAGRHTRLRLDPWEALHARVRANLDEILRSRIKDEGERGRKVTELEKGYFEVLAGRGDHKEFRRALRLATARGGLRGGFDKVLEFYKAGLLGWPSEVANITSNGLFRGSRFLEDTVAGLIDAGLYGVGAKKNRDYFLGEAAVSLRAMRRASVEALKPLLMSEGNLLRLEGGDMAKILEQGALAQDLMMAGGAIDGRIGNFIRFHFDSMQNWDTYFKHIAKTDSLYRDVYRGLKKGDVKWLEARKRTGESLLDTTERIVEEIQQNRSKMQTGQPYDGTLMVHSTEMLKRADDVAKSDTFQKDLEAAGQSGQTFLREHPGLQFLVPFYRTPVNILKEAWDRTPAGFFKLGLKWKKLTPAERIQALSKATVGSAIMGGVASLAASGEITGGGPLSFEEREAMLATGWQPYSFRAGDQWISYQRLEPLASLAGMAADAVEAGKNGDLDAFSSGMQKLADSVAENLTNKTFLSGLSALTGAISDPKRELGTFVKQMQQSVVPNSLGFVPFGHLARAMDPVYREAEPISWGAFTSKIPFMSQTLDPQYGPTGEVRRRTGTALERAVSPFARRPIQEGPIARGSEEIVRLKAVPKAPMRYWTSPQGFRVPLKPEERQRLARALQEATTLIGQRIVKDPSYQRLPKNEMDPRYVYGQKTQQEVLEKLIGKYRARALKQIMPALKQRSRQMYREREL